MPCEYQMLPWPEQGSAWLGASRTDCISRIHSLDMTVGCSNVCLWNQGRPTGPLSMQQLGSVKARKWHSGTVQCKM
jgi:hypothetical protein